MRGGPGRPGVRGEPAALEVVVDTVGTPSAAASTSTTGTPAWVRSIWSRPARQRHHEQPVGPVAPVSGARCWSRWTGDSTLNSTRS